MRALVADEDVVGDARPPLHDGRRRRDHGLCRDLDEVGRRLGELAALRGRRLDAPQRARASARPRGLVVLDGRGVRRGVRLLVGEAVLVHRPWGVPGLLGRVVVVVGAVWCLLGRVVVAVLPGGVLGVERRFALELVVVVHRCCYFVRRCSCMQPDKVTSEQLLPCAPRLLYERQTRAAMEVPINSICNVSCSDVAKPRCDGPAAAAARPP